MLEDIEALIALEQYGTVSEAAVRLRLTQSAVSKRLQSLQGRVGFKLTEPDGRRLRLTSKAVTFLERARPLLAELRGLESTVQTGELFHFSIALADSIAASWGPGVVRRALSEIKGVTVDLHAHRSVVVIESVRLGRYHLGLCTDPPRSTDLIQVPLVEEPMALLHAGCSRTASRSLPLITIEPTTAAWKAIEPLLKEHYPELLKRQLMQVESFNAAAQMAKSGFGDGLVPLGIIMEMQAPERSFRLLPSVVRPVSLLTRKTVYQLTSFDQLRAQLKAAAARHFATHQPAGAD